MPIPIRGIIGRLYLSTIALVLTWKSASEYEQDFLRVCVFECAVRSHAKFCMLLRLLFGRLWDIESFIEAEVFDFGGLKLSSHFTEVSRIQRHELFQSVLRRQNHSFLPSLLRSFFKVTASLLLIPCVRTWLSLRLKYHPFSLSPSIFITFIDRHHSVPFDIQLFSELHIDQA